MVEGPTEAKRPTLSRRYLTVREAALRLGMDTEQMLIWNMVIVIRQGSTRRVPEWCTDPCIAGILPLLSDYFRGEALEYCLLHMRPCGDDRNGAEALMDGEWKLVRDTIAQYRSRFDQILRQCETEDWMSQYTGGRMAAPPAA